jgi:hypothetical protein
MSITYVLEDDNFLSIESKEVKEKLFNEVIKKFEGRRKVQKWKLGSKKALDMQREFVLGAIALLDTLSPDKEHTTISPRIYFDMIRGNYLCANKIYEKKE